jgi:hypothetical protein
VSVLDHLKESREKGSNFEKREKKKKQKQENCKGLERKFLEQL